MKQHNWEFWFFSNLILLLIVMVSGMCIGEAAIEDRVMFKNIISYGSFILFFSLIPCLYVGSKPSKN